MYRRTALAALLSLTVSLVTGGESSAGYLNHCDEPGDYPDVVVSDLSDAIRWGSEGDITAFSIGTTSCNIGTCELQWQASTNLHPVIAQNMYRLKDGRFEQIGQSWLKHGFLALSTPFCSTGCIPTDGSTLGVQCADPYSAGLNGVQSALGPKSEVNVATGRFPYPPQAGSQSTGVVARRLQVHTGDIDPARNAGALYFVEGQYVTQDDALARKQSNNASWAPIELGGGGDPLIGETHPAEAAIHAWQLYDREVRLANIDIPRDGRLIVAARATALGDGYWSYEYAVQNLSSHRSARAFRVRLPAGVNLRNVGFHDVDYHSGEPYDGTDWQAAISHDSIAWATDRFRDNPNANALRWGTLYNFRFEADAPPSQGAAGVDLFRPDTYRPYPRPGYDPYGVRTVVPGSNPASRGDGTAGARLKKRGRH